jgi:hypothetical protein
MFENQKDLYTDEPAYIMGSGPTVLKFYPDNHDGVYIGVGEIFMIPEIRDKLDFLMTEKKHPGHKDLPDKITVFYTHGTKQFARGSPWEPHFNLYKEPDLKEWEPSFMKMEVRSIIFHGFYLALHMGCTPIYLVGCDCTNNKFHPHGNRYKYKYGKLIEGWKDIKRSVAESHPDVEIININPVKLADMFPSIYTDTKDREFLERNPASP